MAEARDGNGKQVAIDFIRDDVNAIFPRLQKLESDGCAVGRYLSQTLAEMRSDQRAALAEQRAENKKTRVLLIVVALTAAAAQGPDLVGLIARLL